MKYLAVRLPERSMLFVLLRRGASIWLLARLMLVVLMVVQSGRSEATLSPLATLMLAMIVGGLGLLETSRQNEHRFLANLGVSQPTIVLLSTIPALVAECTIALVGLE